MPLDPSKCDGFDGSRSDLRSVATSNAGSVATSNAGLGGVGLWQNWPFGFVTSFYWKYRVATCWTFYLLL